MLKKYLLVTVTFILLANLVFSEETKEKTEEEKTTVLKHEVVVTATRVKTPVKEIASSVEVITEEELKQTRKETVLDALQAAAGLSVIRSGPVGGASSIQIRGADNKHTLVMMDGMEVNDPVSPDRSFDMSLLLVENIDRIEIIRGPQSTLYGSDAIGGIINIITKKGRGKPDFHFTTIGGSYKTISGSAGINGSTEKIHYSFNASHYRTKGFSSASTEYAGNSEKDGFRNSTLSGRVGFDISTNVQLDFTVRNINSKIDIDNQGGAYGDDPNNVQDYDAFFFKGQARTLLMKNRWEQLLQFSLVDYDRKYDNAIDELHPFSSDKSEYKSQLFKLSWQNNFFIHENNTLTFGIEYQAEQGESESFFEDMWGVTETVFPLQKSTNMGIYIQDQIKLAGQFFATLGIRHDVHNQAGASTTYRIAPAYFIKQTGTKIKATLGTGFKAPSLYQLFAPGSVWGPIGNENLEPEKSKSWDAGIEQHLFKNKMVLGATYFSNSYENLIDFDWALGYINVNEAYSKGAEFTLRTEFYKNLFFKASYTLTDAKNKETEECLLRRPKHKLTASLNYRFAQKGNAHLSLVYVGEREDQAWINWVATRVAMSPYVLLNLSASYNIIDNIQIFVRLDNILNETYEMIKGYATPGLSVYAGVEISN